MVPSTQFLLFLFVLCTIPAESADPLGNYCDTNSNITNSNISSNIDRLLAKLVQGTIINGFTATSLGYDEDRVYGLSQCRADVSSNDCSSCIKDAAREIRTRCPNQADARIWYDYCFLRYDIENFIRQVDTSVGIFYYNTGKVTDPETFNKELGKLMDQIVLEAQNPQNKGNGRGKTTLSPFLTLYALVQCTRDLMQVDCAQCLAIAIGNFEGICKDRKGCRVLYSSCYVRYELYPFYFPLDNQEILANTSVVASYVSVISKP
ncbi:hypothetical protein NMG60_11034449 [Bertholletia excelsa]